MSLTKNTNSAMAAESAWALRNSASESASTPGSLMNFEVANHDGDVGFLPVGTSVIWLSCLMVGIIGLWLPYPRPIAPAQQPTPVQAQIMHVELSEDST